MYCHRKERYGGDRGCAEINMVVQEATFTPWPRPVGNKWSK